MSDTTRIAKQQGEQVREVPGFKGAVEGKLSNATLKDHGGNAYIEMNWNLSEASNNARVFRLSIDGKEAFIELDELLMYTRLV